MRGVHPLTTSSRCEPERRETLTLPNLITILRLLLVPAVVAALLTGHTEAALAGFLVAGISDGVDGFIARHFNQRSKLGTWLDPLADKLLLVSTFLALAALGELPLWLAAIAVGRDMAILLGLGLAGAAGRPIEVKPLFVSKANTAVQIVLVAVVLFELALGISAGPLRPLFVAASAVLTVASAAAYLLGWLRHMGGAGERKQPSG